MTLSGYEPAGGTMTQAEAVLTLYRFRHVEGAVSAVTADRAREFLKAEWGASRGLRADETEAGHEVIEEARSMGAVAEWPDVWRGAEGRLAAITSHWYGLDARDMRAILAYADSKGFRVHVNGHGSWKNAGDALIVEYVRKA